MSNRPSGVPAMPNRSVISARVTEVSQSQQLEGKWRLTLEVLESKPLAGPNFTREGQTFKAFTVACQANLEPGEVIKAQAEFVGDEAGGALRLTHIERQQGLS